MDEGLYNFILLKGDVLYYFKCLIKILTSHSKLVSEAYHSNLSSNEGQMSHDLQPGDYVYKKNIKDSFQPRWKGPHQVSLTSSSTENLKEIDCWIHISHLKRAPAPDWSIERIADLQLTFKQFADNKENPTPG